MGHWSFGSFDNDDAADWAHQLDGIDDLSPIEEAIDSVLTVGSGYLEAPAASAAVAAIEVLAQLTGDFDATKELPEVADQWIRRISVKPDVYLIGKAKMAISRILGEQSELKELWLESDDFGAWENSIKGLQARI